jgi:D-arabinono-1,4-lactone oxidase
MDLFGDGSGGKPALEQFLKEVEYTRLEWWPQRGAERMVTWQCQQIVPQPGFRPARYQEFGDSPDATELAISIIYTIIGNLDDLSRAEARLEASFDQLDQVLDFFLKARGLGRLGEILARAISLAAEGGVDAALTLLRPFAPLIKQILPDVFPGLLGTFIPLDSDKQGMDKGEPQSFRDYSWQGLPMDNQASDVLVPTEFTEIWTPVIYTQKVMNILNTYFAEPKSAHEALARTGTYGWELYGAKPSPFWMSNSYTDGGDEWKDGVLRVDIYWFVSNLGNPAEVFYPQFWKLLRDKGIPYRLHWGKFRPIVEPGDPEGWVAFFKSQHPRWDDFLALRARKDPNNIFLTDYWRSHFGLWDAPRPGVKG